MRIRAAMATVAIAAAPLLSGCGGSGARASASAPAGTAASQAQSAAGTTAGSPSTGVTTTTVTVRRPPPPAYPPYPVVLGAALSGAIPSHYIPAVKIHGRTAAWIARAPSGVTLLSFNQRLVRLVLHAGTVDPGGSGWPHGASAAGEQGQLVSGFNGGFKFSTGAGGFVAGGRVAEPLRGGLASIVTYADGHTDIGSWRSEVPAPGAAIASVRQNLTLLIDHGQVAASAGCAQCWGATLGGGPDVARSALGVTADGRLVWAGGEDLAVGTIAGAMTAAKVVRAVELDINPEWVAAYLYHHHRGPAPPVPVLVVPGANGIAGGLLAPYSRDFFTVIAR
jgi:hypothetical protein